MWFQVQAMEIDPDNKVALSVIRRLEPIVQERREKMKEEMLGEHYCALKVYVKPSHNVRC